MHAPHSHVRYVSLDGLRGVAAVAVMFLHTSEFTLDKTLPGAGRAVDFFFLLSGFVLSAVYTAPRVRYVWARVIRLYPMVLFGVVLGAALMLTTGLTGPWAKALVLNLLGLPYPGITYTYDHALWSIAVEAELSVLFIALARFRLPFLLVALVAAAAAATLFEDPNDALGIFSRGLLPFVTGVVIQRLPIRSENASGMPLAAAILLVCLLTIPGIQAIPVLRTGAFAVVLLTALADPPQRLRAACEYLGRLSYPLYAVHWPIGWWAARHGITGAWGFSAVCICSIAVAHAALVFYDEPVRHFLAGRMKRTQRLEALST